MSNYPAFAYDENFCYKYMHMFFRSPEIPRREKLERIRGMTENATNFVIDHLKKHGDIEDVVVPIGRAPENLTPEHVVDNVGMAVIRGISRKLQQRGEDMTIPNIFYNPVETVSINDPDMRKGIAPDQYLVIVLSTREGVPAGVATI